MDLFDYKEEDDVVVAPPPVEERKEEQPVHTEQQGSGSTSSVDYINSIKSKMMISLAPTVKESNLVNKELYGMGKTMVYHNVKASDLYAPIQGPTMPFSSAIIPGQKNTLTGFVEDEAVNDEVFKQQYSQFAVKGYAIDPSMPTVNGAENYVYAAYANWEAIQAAENAKKKKKRKGADAAVAPEKDPSNVNEYKGPWARPEDKTPSGPEKVVEEEEEKEEAATKEPSTAATAADKEDGAPTKKARKYEEEIRGIFHGGAMIDSLGRSWAEPPKSIKEKQDDKKTQVRSEEISADVVKLLQQNNSDNSRMDIVRRYKPASEIICYPPKKLIHTWSGHEKGVNKVELFPRYGHLLLSAANDGMVKIWDVYNSKKCMMTYHGHTLGVRDASFSNDGRQFLSAAFDRNVRLWDTETGKCISTFTTGKVPYVARFYPKNNNEFLAGQGDKKIIQWDIRENKIVQEYDRHLGTVNSITFVDDDRRFLTTSDDKSIRVWDYGFSVDIKLIAEPHMHSMPAVTKHPNGKWLLMQSLDNQILVYSARDKIRINNKKVFKGHIVAGYACQIAVSPDGQYVASGDHLGKLWLWEWKTGKLKHNFPRDCHSTVLMSCVWHPHEPSRVVTAGWDNQIKYWD